MPRLSRRVPTPLCACRDRCTPGIGPETTIALATASTGTTMVVWGVKGQLRSATLLADGQTWSAPTTIASGSAIVDGLRLVPSQDGSVALLWLGIPKLDPKLQSSCRGRRVRISRFDSSGSWSDPKTLTTEAAERNSCTYDVELKDATYASLTKLAAEKRLAGLRSGLPTYPQKSWFRALAVLRKAPHKQGVLPSHPTFGQTCPRSCAKKNGPDLR
jgi:hypothetical protein